MSSGQRTDAAARVLVIDRDPDSGQVVLDELGRHAPDAVHAELARSGRQAIDRLRADSFDIILADIDSLGDIAGLAEDAMARLARLAGGALIVSQSDGPSVSAGIAAMRAGAHDFIAKPVSAQALVTRITEIARRHGKARALQVDASTAGKGTDLAGFIGSSTQMQVVYEQIGRITPSAAPVFITGEGGTGKKLCAEALHKRGPRTKKPFVAIHCGAIPGDMMEAELFGAARGAFTGAVADRRGVIEAGDGGTLFLDEIGELDPGLQAKLLGFLQTGKITRVGETAPRAVNVRVVCATSRNPMHLIAERRFREDLFYRLHVLPIHLPPLRQRPADILPLAKHFLAQFAGEEHKRFDGFAPASCDALIARDWPGNVRQLRNLVRRLVVMFDGGTINPEMMAAADIEGRATAQMTRQLQTGSPETAILPLWRQEQRIIEDTLAWAGGNIAQAAAALQISPSTIYRKRQSWAELEHRSAGAA